MGWTGTEGLESKATSAGVNEVLTKPFNKANIEEMILSCAYLPLSNIFLKCLVRALNTPIVRSNTFYRIGGTIRVEPLPQLNLDTPLLDLSQLSPSDFLISELVMPKTAKVLVVEDCKLTQHVVGSLLKELTSNVEQVFDGQQAIDAFVIS